MVEVHLYFDTEIETHKMCRARSMLIHSNQREMIMGLVNIFAVPISVGFFPESFTPNFNGDTR